MHHDLISDPAPLATGDGRRVWHFRPPRGGDFGRLLIDEGLVCAEFGVREDLSEHMDPGQVLDAVEMANPNEKPSRIRTMSTQLNALVNVMQRGDLVLASLPGGDTIGIGMIDPDLREDPEGRPARSVRWLRDPVPRSAFLPDLLTVTGTLVNITEVTRPGIIDRVRGLIRDGRDPGPSGPEGTVPATLNALLAREHERIKDRIGAVFTGHAMADLVGELLRLEGLTVSVGAPGPDGGVDLIAGGGSMGIAPPRIVGQVKSGLQVTGDEALQGLIGNLHGAGGDTALLVSWSGVTRQARGRAYAMGFRVQIWDGDEVVRRFLTGYDRLPDRIRDAVRLNPVNTYRLAD
jgi:restriction system protein